MDGTTAEIFFTPTVQTSSTLSFFPRAAAALLSVESVAESFSGSNRRSTAERLVCCMSSKNLDKRLFKLRDGFVDSNIPLIV